ncbi:ABC transporter permease [Flavitalea sp. BT771]|uniref:ABC transporter permease n=1 Tax=Flavitalea sp. BT771 TaxID=3063329 RepID=UPI0026E35F95|nr:ABC transporter permease [Flavitalea sp. BT771]MDO6433909.1 ABC transporter permease [Flavitalea sp. BT771]MDV6222186.1 ABC transporter permease [Flavitalea sp. BT771]
MLKNILRTAWRNLFKTRIHSFINITGLSIGMAVALLTALWIMDEASYDKSNEHYSQVARVMQTTTLNGQVSTSYSVPLPIAAELRNNYKDAFRRVALSQWTRDHILSSGDRKFTEKGKFMEPEGPEILSLKMREGTRAGLNDPASILISASTARALFGNEEALNRTVRIDNKANAKVTGVYEDLPSNSQFFHLQFISSWQLFRSMDPEVAMVETSWGWDAIEIFVQLADNINIDQVSARIRNVKLDKVKNAKDLAVYKPVLFLHPMARWHLYSEFSNGVNTGGRIQLVWLFGVIGCFVLLLACVNFMNLSTARSERRAKEVGIRKAIGSSRAQLVAQFFGESLLAAFFAFVLALVLTDVILPFFNDLTHKEIFLPWRNAWFWTYGLVCTTLTGIVAGLYPALYLSSFRPVKVLKGLFRSGPWAALPRKALVVLQFTVSVALIIGTVIVYRQVQFVKDRPVGYNKDGLISLQMNTADFFGKQEMLRKALLQTDAVVEMAESSSPATWVWRSNGGFEWRGKDPATQAEFGTIAVTHGYGKTLGWQFTEGRDFSRGLPTDSSGLILNQAAVKFMGLQHPVGESITWDHHIYRVIGVINNMLMESPYEQVKPAIYYLGAEAEANFILIRMKPGSQMKASLGKIQAILQQYVPSAPFDYKFVDEEYANKFGEEEQTGRLSLVFTSLAIFISCMGLFGMASFMAEQRIKEIGIRKILGASVYSVWYLLSKEFILLVIISLFIAGPVAYYCMHGWLQHYTYHTEFAWWIFATAGLVATFITLVTVSYQALTAALSNPAESLRSE